MCLASTHTWKIDETRWNETTLGILTFAGQRNFSGLFHILVYMTKQKAIQILSELIPYLEETNNDIGQIVTENDIKALKYILKDYVK